METRQAMKWVAGENTPTKTWITRVLNFGTWEEWQLLKKEVSDEHIRQAIEHPLPGQWTKHGKAFAETIFNCQLPDEVLIKYNG